MPTPVKEFSERYRNLENGELLALALQRHQLEPTALVALDAELAARSLGETPLREFENQLRTKIEPDTAVADEEHEQKEELPSPSELPDDWFDEDADSSIGSLASSRPKGVTVSALLFWLNGFIGIGWGGLAIAERESSLSLSTGVLVLALGILYLVVGSGLWRLNSRARTLAEVLCWLFVILTSLTIVAAAIEKLYGFAVDPVTIIGTFMGLLWQMLWALYLGSESTRQAFFSAQDKRQNKETS